MMLRNLVSRDIVRQLNKVHQINERSRPCPNCHKKMEIAEIRYPMGFTEFEHCRKCALIWFEAGAIVKLLRVADKDALASQTPEKILQEIAKRHEKPKVAPRAVRSKVVPFVFPRATLAIAAVAAILLPITARTPALLERFAFLPSAPWRGTGLPWLTSLFLNSRSQIHGLAALLLFGIFAERRLGADRLIRLFLVSGFFANLSYFLALRATESLVYGSTPAIAGIFGYCLATAPYREYLFPSDRLRSQAGTFFAFVVAGIFLAGLMVFWDYFHVAFGTLSVGTSGTVVGSVSSFLGTAAFFAHLCGFAVGVLFGMTDALAQSES